MPIGIRQNKMLLGTSWFPLLIMICPLEPNEKQALLEAPTFRTRVDLLITLLEMATMGGDDGESGYAIKAIKRYRVQP